MFRLGLLRQAVYGAVNALGAVLYIELVNMWAMLEASIEVRLQLYQQRLKQGFNVRALGRRCIQGCSDQKRADQKNSGQGGAGQQGNKQKQ